MPDQRRKSSTKTRLRPISRGSHASVTPTGLHLGDEQLQQRYNQVRVAHGTRGDSRGLQSCATTVDPRAPREANLWDEAGEDDDDDDGDGGIDPPVPDELTVQQQEAYVQACTEVRLVVVADCTTNSSLLTLSHPIRPWKCR